MKESIYIKYKDEFIEKYNKGMSFREIAKEYSITHGVVKRLIENNVVIRPKSKIHLIPEEEILKKYESGCKVGELSKIYEVSPSTIKRILSKHTKVETNYKYEHLLENFKEDYRNGMSTFEISQKYEVSRGTVADYLRFEEERIRTTEEANRKSFLDYDYFKLDKLDTEKMEILAILYRKINMYEKGSRLIISGYVQDFEDIYNKYISKFSSSLSYTESIPGVFAYEIKSKTFYNNLKNTFDNIFTSNISDEFMEIFLKHNSSICTRGIYFPIYFFNKDSLRKYFKENLSMELPISDKKKSLAIQKQEYILKLIKKFPFLIDSIKESEHYEIPFWNFIRNSNF